MARSPITTHILDTAQGSPAAGVIATLERRNDDGSWQQIGDGATDDDGRIADLLPPGSHLDQGMYRLLFEVGEYFHLQDVASFYRRIPIEFEVVDVDQHYHVPLLLNPFGYSTYRGS